MKIIGVLLAGMALVAIQPAAAGAQQARVSVIESVNARLRTTGKRKSAAIDRSAANSKADAAKVALLVPTQPANPLANAARTADSALPSPPAATRTPKAKKGT